MAYHIAAQRMGTHERAHVNVALEFRICNEGVLEGQDSELAFYMENSTPISCRQLGKWYF
jgi:hypothetical protein